MLDIFKEKKENIWQKFANETDGKFIEGESWHSDRTEFNYKNFQIVFDNYTLWSGKYNQIYTRIIIPFYSETDFNFEIYPADILTKIEKLFGAQDVEIGRAEFDKAFMIKSNNALKVKTLLQNQNIRKFIETQKKGNFEISKRNGIWKPELGKNKFQLSFYFEGEEENIERLKEFRNFFIELIDQLIKTDIIFIKPNS